MIEEYEMESCYPYRCHRCGQSVDVPVERMSNTDLRCECGSRVLTKDFTPVVRLLKAR